MLKRLFARCVSLSPARWSRLEVWLADGGMYQYRIKLDWPRDISEFWSLHCKLTAGITNHPQPLFGEKGSTSSTHETIWNIIAVGFFIFCPNRNGCWPPHFEAFTKGLDQSFVSRQLVGSSFELGQTRSHRLSRPSEGHRLRNLRSKTYDWSKCWVSRGVSTALIFLQCRYWRSRWCTMKLLSLILYRAREAFSKRCE